MCEDELAADGDPFELFATFALAADFNLNENHIILSKHLPEWPQVRRIQPSSLRRRLPSQYMGQSLRHERALQE